MTKTNTPNLNEDGLVDALLNGDRQSFEKLYTRFAQALHGLFVSWVNDNHTAENLLQDAFVKAWLNRQTYDPSKGRLFTWLYNIARNVCIDYYRSRQYKKGKVSVLSDDVSLVLDRTKMTNPAPDTIGVRKLVSLLRFEEKQVVEMMYFKGLTQKEIAELMNMPLGTVKTRMSMAIKNLRSFFNNDWLTAQQKMVLDN